MNCVKKEKSVYGLIFCMLLLAPGMAANAETNEFYLDEMVVTANRTEVSLLDANANISVVTREELENKHFQDLGEAIKGVTGVNVQNMGSSGEAYADNALYINGSKNIVFLIDGVRVNFNGSDSDSPCESTSIFLCRNRKVLRIRYPVVLRQRPYTSPISCCV